MSKRITSRAGSTPTATAIRLTCGPRVAGQRRWGSTVASFFRTTFRAGRVVVRRSQDDVDMPELLSKVVCQISDDGDWRCLNIAFDCRLYPAFECRPKCLSQRNLRRFRPPSTPEPADVL